MKKLEDLIGSLDKSALELCNGKYDDNIFELDFNLWGLVHILAEENPDGLKAAFEFSDKTIETIKSATRLSVSSLASAHLLSFVLIDDKEKIEHAIDNLELDNNQYIYLFNTVHYDDISFAYWLLTNRLASKDVSYASVVFDIPKYLLEKIKHLTDLKLRNLASQFPPTFRLRYCQNLISDRLNGHENRAISYLKSIQLSLK